ncbi:MAG: metallophosphoesterase [Lachnospiraceae bacterium]
MGSGITRRIFFIGLLIAFSFGQLMACNSKEIQTNSVPIESAESELESETEQESVQESAQDVELTDKNQITDVVINVGADETQIYITWYSATSGSQELQFAEKSGKDEDGDGFPEDCQALKSKSIVTDKAGYWSNYVTVTGLKSNTDYIYRMSSGVYRSPLYQYSTNTIGQDADFSFIAVGDPQIGSTAVETDTDNWIHTLKTALSAEKASFILSVGDQINNSALLLESEYSGFLSQESMLQEIPIAVTVGNHDAPNIAAFSQHFTIPNVSQYGSIDDFGEEDNDYFFRYNGALFMVLDSNCTDVSQHKSFLEETLRRDPDAEWNIVVFHHSIYSAADHVNDANIELLREGLAPTLFALDIDVVLMGHDHVYDRSYIMGSADGLEAEVIRTPAGAAQTNIVDPKGVQYITLNSSTGSKYYEITSELYPYSAVISQVQIPTYSVVDITDRQLSVTTYTSTDKTVLDEVNIIHSTVP